MKQSIQSLFRGVPKLLQRELQSELTGDYYGVHVDVLQLDKKGMLSSPRFKQNGQTFVQTPFEELFQDMKILSIPGYGVWNSYMKNRNNTDDNYPESAHFEWVKSMMELAPLKGYKWLNFQPTPYPKKGSGYSEYYMIPENKYHVYFGHLDPNKANKIGKALFFTIFRGSFEEVEVAVFPKIADMDGEGYMCYEDRQQWQKMFPCGGEMKSLKQKGSAQIGWVEISNSHFDMGKGRIQYLCRHRAIKAIMQLGKDTKCTAFARAVAKKVMAGQKIIVTTTDMAKMLDPKKIYMKKIGIREFQTFGINEEVKSVGGQITSRISYRPDAMVSMAKDRFEARVADIISNADDMVEKSRLKGDKEDDTMKSFRNGSRATLPGFYTYAGSPFLFRALYPRVYRKLATQGDGFVAIPRRFKGAIQREFGTAQKFIDAVRYPLPHWTNATKLRFVYWNIDAITVCGEIDGVQHYSRMDGDFDGDKILLGLFGCAMPATIRKSAAFKAKFVSKSAHSIAKEWMESFAIAMPEGYGMEWQNLLKEVTAQTLVAKSDFAIKVISEVQYGAECNDSEEIIATLSVVYQSAMTGMKHAGTAIDPNVAMQIVMDYLGAGESVEARNRISEMIANISEMLSSVKNFEIGEVMAARHPYNMAKLNCIDAVHNAIEKRKEQLETAGLPWQRRANISPFKVGEDVIKVGGTGKPNSGYAKLVRFMCWYLGENSIPNSGYMPVKGETIRKWSAILRVEMVDGSVMSWSQWLGNCSRNNMSAAPGTKQVKARINDFCKTLISMATAMETDWNIVSMGLAQAIGIKPVAGSDMIGYHKFDLVDHMGNAVGPNAVWDAYIALTEMDPETVRDNVMMAMWHALTFLLGPYGTRAGKGFGYRYLVGNELYWSAADWYNDEGGK